MADNLEGRLRRKRRKIRQDQDWDQDHIEDAGQQDNVPEKLKPPLAPVYDFLHVANLIVDMEIPILFPGDVRPRNSYALLGSGGSFLVFKEARTMNDVVVQPHEIWSLADEIVLKRTRSQQPDSFAKASNKSARYASIMAELQILTSPSVREHENIIDFLGLTWDFEANTDGLESVWPVLALEAAQCTMETFLYETRDRPLPSRLKYCHDIAKALSFLHNSGVAHCDIKSENVLICMSSLSGMVAKLTDFGSAILDISPETHLPYGIAGTPPWNAPEWNLELAGLDILKADTYSFGMLIWRAAATCGVLEDIRSDVGQREDLIRVINIKKMSDEILEVALQDVQASNSGSQHLEEICGLLQHTVKRDIKLRWDMSRVELLLEGIIKESYDSKEDQEPHLVGSEDSTPAHEIKDLGLDNSVMEDDGRIHAASFMPFNDDFERFYERFEDDSRLVQQQLIASLKACCDRKMELPYDAAEAAYQLSHCYIDGFGTEASFEEGIKWSLQAAREGNLKAKADIYRISSALEKHDANDELCVSRLVKWLAEAAKVGSAQALEDLKDLDKVVYEDSLNHWSQRFCQIETELGHKIPSEEEFLCIIEGLSKSELVATELNERGHGFIHLAASLNYFQAMKKLLDSGVDINKLNLYGENPLLCACRAGNATLALDLLRDGAKTHLAYSGESPLHWLIACDDTQVKLLAEGLISEGIDLEAQHTITEQNEYNFDVYPHGTPLDWAVSRRKMTVIDVLIEIGADPFNECSQYSPLNRAVSLHDAEIIELLFRSRHATAEKKKDFDSTGQTLLFHAIYCNGPYIRFIQHGKRTIDAARDTIRILLDHGCDPACIDKDGTSVMHLAAGFADREVAEMLLNDFGFETFINNSCGELARTPLLQAIASRKLDVVQLLISRGADVYCVSQGQTLLHLLAAIQDEHHSIECLKLLNVSQRVDLNTSVDYPDINGGLTAFETAIFSGNLLVADHLFSQGADVQGPQSREPHFLSLLISQPSWYSLQALEYYMEKAKPSFIVQSKNQLTAFHVAASMQSLLADTTTAELKFDILLREFPGSAQLNARTIATPNLEVAGGQTPLHYAAKFGAHFAVRRLLEAGVDVNIRDDEGYSALDVAKKYANRVYDLVDEQWMEVPRAVRELQDAVNLLERAIDGRPLPDIARRRSMGEYTRARFSRMGFEVDDS